MILFLEVISLLAAVFSVGYYLLMTLTLGVLRFSGFWLILAAVMVLFAFACGKWRHGVWPLPGWAKVLIGTCYFLALALFVILGTCVLVKGHHQPAPGARYCILLGCKVEGTRPSMALGYRIEAAEQYLKENPETILIASGGQGPDEGISEAQCIFNELTAHGIAPERIILEERSTSTRENLQNSLALMEDPGDYTVIVTSDYHVFRGVGIARKVGLTNVDGLGGYPGPIMGLNYAVREVLAIVKDFVIGNL